MYDFDLMIIGNGFDIAVGMETRYENFCDKLKLAYDNKDYQKFFKKLDVKYKTENHINRGLQLFYSNVREESSNFFVKYLVKVDKGDWNQIEKRIEDIVKTFDFILSSIDVQNLVEDDTDFLLAYDEGPIYGFNIKNIDQLDNFSIIRNINNWFDCSIEFFNENKEVIIKHKYFYGIDYFDIQSKIQKFKNDVVKMLYNEFVEFTKLFSLYLNVFAYLKKLKKDIPIMCDKYIVYNYTDTVERMLAKGDDEKLLYIHNKYNFIEYVEGKWEPQNIIFGIDDKVELKVKGLNCFKKINQRILYDSDAKKIHHFKKYDIYRIGIYGHSLDLIDLDSLRLILSNIKGLEKITIFYYDMEAKKDLIQNLIDILTRENFYSLFYSNKIEFIQSSEINLKL